VDPVDPVDTAALGLGFGSGSGLGFFRRALGLGFGAGSGLGSAFRRALGAGLVFFARASAAAFLRGMTSAILPPRELIPTLQ